MYLFCHQADGSLNSYANLPASSEESHYEYAFPHQETDITGYVNPLALNTDNVKYATIKDSDVAVFYVDIDDTDKTDYLELTVNQKI